MGDLVCLLIELIGVDKKPSYSFNVIVAVIDMRSSSSSSSFFSSSSSFVEPPRHKVIQDRPFIVTCPCSEPSFMRRRIHGARPRSIDGDRGVAVPTAGVHPWKQPRLVPDRIADGPTGGRSSGCMWGSRPKLFWVRQGLTGPIRSLAPPS